MVATSPQTISDKLYEEIASIASLPRQEVLQRLVFVEKRVSIAKKKNELDQGDYYYLKSRIAMLRGSAIELRSYSDSLKAFRGYQGGWIQFENFLNVGFLQDAYDLVKEIPPEGLELTKASWLCFMHAATFSFGAAKNCYEYINRAYPEVNPETENQLMLADTAMKVCEQLSKLGCSYNIADAIQKSLISAVPETMLAAPGVSFARAEGTLTDANSLLIDVVIVPNDESIEDLAHISRNFAHSMQDYLSDELLESVMVCLSFSDDELHD